MFVRQNRDLAAGMEATFTFQCGALLRSLAHVMTTVRAAPVARVCCDILKSCIGNGRVRPGCTHVKETADIQPVCSSVQATDICMLLRAPMVAAHCRLTLQFLLVLF